MLQIGMQIVKTTSGRALWGSVCEGLDETGWITLHANTEHLELEYCKSEKSVKLLTTQDSGTVFIFAIFYSSTVFLSAPNRHAKFIDIFWPGALRICVWVPGQSMLIHFASHFEGGKSGATAVASDFVSSFAIATVTVAVDNCISAKVPWPTSTSAYRHNTQVMA